MEENTTKSKCQYCGKEMIRGLTMHERTCKLNPELRKANIQHEKEKDQVDIETAKQLMQEQKPLIISDVQQIVVDIDSEGELFPWFEDAQGNKKLEGYNFIGIHENIPCVLIMTIYGRLVPPYLVPGFIGMFPKYHEFPEVRQEPQQKEETSINTSTEPIISPLEEEKFEQVIPQEPIHAQTEKKQSLLGRILGTKEKTTEKTTSSSELAKRIIAASNEPKTT